MVPVTRLRKISANRFEDISLMIETAYPNGVQIMNVEQRPNGAFNVYFCLPQNLIDNQVIDKTAHLVEQIEQLKGEIDRLKETKKRGK